MNNLLYLSAGSNKWGTGHLWRSLELISVFREEGLHINAVAIVPDRSEMQKLSSITGAYDKCIQSIKELGSVEELGIVVDVHTDLQPELLHWLKGQGKSVFALDWYYDFGGIVVETANLRGGAEELKYAIIRKEFHDVLLKRNESRPKYDAVAVIGGGDHRRYLQRIYRFFSEDKLFARKNIAIVLGQMVEEELGEPSSETISVLKSPGNIARIMADASVGITNGGTTLMEFTMLGVPAIIFPQSEQEDNFVCTFLEQGSAVMGSSDPEEFAGQITKIWDSELLHKTMAGKARALIDGHGAERITDLVLNTLFKEEYSRK